MSDPSCSVAETLTITAASQTSTLTACPTFTGSIQIADPFDGDFTIDSTLEELDGSITISDVNALTSVSFTALTHLLANLTVSNVPSLTTLSFPALQSMETLTLMSTGPALTSLNMPELAHAVKIAIYGTALTDLAGLGSLQSLVESPNNLGAQPGLDIHENSGMKDIALDSLIDCGGPIYIFGNNDTDTYASVAFPVLNFTTSIEIAQASSITLSKLQNASMEIHDNPTLETLELPAYEYSNNLTLVNNPLLSSLSVPVLKAVESSGGEETIDGVIYNMSIVVNGCDLLRVIDFPALTTVSGGLDFNGSFENITLPSLTSSTGPFIINSSTSLINTTCAHLATITDPLDTTPIINGNLTCTYPGSDEHSTSSGKSNEGAKIGGGVGGTVAFFVLAALAILGWFYYRMIRKRNERRRAGWDAQDGVELR